MTEEQVNQSENLEPMDMQLGEIGEKVENEVPRLNGIAVSCDKDLGVVVIAMIINDQKLGFNLTPDEAANIQKAIANAIAKVTDESVGGCCAPSVEASQE